MVKIYKKDIEITKIKEGINRQKKEGISTLEHFLEDKKRPSKVLYFINNVGAVFRIWRVSFKCE